MNATRLPATAILAVTLTVNVNADINIAMHNGGVTVNAMAPGNNPTTMGTVVDTSTDTWNDFANNGGVGTTFSGESLDNADGTPSGATLDVDSGFTTYNNNGWGGTTKDRVMMEGWYGFHDAEFLTVNNLPSDLTTGGYSVIVYGDSNDTNRTMNYTLDDGITSVTKTIQDNANFTGTFSKGENFVVFGGLTGSSFTITGNPGASDARCAINGIQIAAGDLRGLEISSFTATSLFAAPGSTVTLDWVTSGADVLTLDPGGVDVTGLTTTNVVVNADSTYTLSATDTGAPATITSSLTIRTAPVINLFEAVQKTARDTADVRLVWDITGAETLTIVSDVDGTVYSAPDAAAAQSGSTVITGVADDSTFTATTTFTGSDPATAQSSVDIRDGADPFSLEETILADGPLAYYRFEETSPTATRLLDHSPNARDSLGISTGGAVPNQPGAVGSAWDFDNGSVELDLNPDPSLGDFSIALAARIDTPVSNGGTHSLVSQQNSPSGNGRSLIQVAGADGDLSSWLGDQGRQDFGVGPAAGDWCHMTFVYDHGDGEFRFHVNGSLVSTLTGLTAGPTIGNYILAANKGQTTEFLRGALDEVAVFDFQLDDPDDDGDPADSRIPDHYAAYLRDAAPLLGFSASALEITQGQSIDLAWKVGDAATTIEIDNGVGDVTGSTSNGLGSTAVSPTATTTYTITVNGTETRQVTVVVNIPILITSAEFDANGDFAVVAINLVEGTDYDLFFSSDLVPPFTPVGVQITADATGTATFIDTLADPANDPVFFYRVEALGP